MRLEVEPPVEDKKVRLEVGSPVKDKEMRLEVGNTPVVWVEREHKELPERAAVECRDRLLQGSRQDSP